MTSSLSEFDEAEPISSESRVGRIAGGLVLYTIGLMPLLVWAHSPSLFDDDLARVGSFRRATVAESLIRPFNEHVAPLFEMLGWICWWSSANEVTGVTRSFLIAALCLTALTAGALAIWVRLELGSDRLAGLAALLLVWQTASSETTLWYSASSFQGSALMTLLSLIGAVHAVRAGTGSRRSNGLVFAALAAAGGPMFSAVGLLAGPLATLRLILSSDGTVDRNGTVRRDCHATVLGQSFRKTVSLHPPLALMIAGVPLLGTAVYLVLLMVSPGRVAVAGIVRQHLDLWAAAWAAAQAPTLVLAPALGGFEPLTGRWPDYVAVPATLTMAWIVVRRMNQERPQRAFLGVCLGWVVGGYALTYGPRAHSGDDWIFAVGRYHLFPMIGAVGMVVAIVAAFPVPRGYAVRSRKRRVGFALALLGLLLLGTFRFHPRWRAAEVGFRFPDQIRTWSAAGRLEQVCRSEGVPLEQAIRVVPPTIPRWYPRSAPFHPILYLFGTDGPDAHRPDPEAKTRILARLDQADREAIFEGLDARRAGALANDAAIPSRRFSTFMTFTTGSDLIPGTGLIHWAEFDPPVAGREVQALALQVADDQAAQVRVEVWWAGETEAWTPRRSVVWQGEAEHRWLLLNRLPHWRSGADRSRFRLVRRGRPWVVGSSTGGDATPVALDVAHPGGPSIID